MTFRSSGFDKPSMSPTDFIVNWALAEDNRASEIRVRSPGPLYSRIELPTVLVVCSRMPREPLRRREVADGGSIPAASTSGLKPGIDRDDRYIASKSQTSIPGVGL